MHFLLALVLSAPWRRPSLLLRGILLWVPGSTGLVEVSTTITTCPKDELSCGCKYVLFHRVCIAWHCNCASFQHCYTVSNFWNWSDAHGLFEYSFGQFGAFQPALGVLALLWTSDFYIYNFVFGSSVIIGHSQPIHGPVPHLNFYTLVYFRSPTATPTTPNQTPSSSLSSNGNTSESPTTPLPTLTSSSTTSFTVSTSTSLPPCASCNPLAGQNQRDITTSKQLFLVKILDHNVNL
ncbi:predicted protein [Aspergillus terreus NIH2624]|uniref:Uncharacterized protein n=1 Tax=Aspergillus terreus (strain NIH 2624 / FGSC A1156) TaxID=341663 RepID=Q0CVY3_ASPTN|nr:uncharacterized protein ATEG_02151 [Aspergillus terreus NIH2624]EAU37113.1 predicted protein [Aspergillus terreus NIH2624]